MFILLLLISSITEPTEKVKPIVLNPVPITNERLASRLGKPITTTTTSGATAPKTTENTYSTSSYLSVSGQRLVNYKSKTDDLERYIAEIEAGEAKADTSSASSVQTLTSKVPSVKRGQRRYTDSRHPTSELPDMTYASLGALNESTSTVEKPSGNRRRTQQFLA